MIRSRFFCAALISGLAGCATNPVALDQANNTVKLIQNLQTELTRYQTNVKLSAQRRLKSTQQSDIGTLEIAREHQWGNYLYKESGLASELETRARLRDAADAYSRIIADQDKAQEDLATRLNALTKALPSLSEKLGTVQKAMAKLGVELSARERLTIVTKFLRQAKCIVDQSAKPANSAAANTAPTSGGSSPPAGCTTGDTSAVTAEKT